MTIRHPNNRVPDNVATPDTTGPCCKVGRHPEVQEINERLATDAMSVKDVADKYGLNYSTVWRHRNGHIPAQLAESAKAIRLANADNILHKFDKTIQEIEEIAFSVDIDLAHKLNALRTLLTGLKDLGALQREVQERQHHGRDWRTDPDFLAFQRDLAAALAPHPAALAAVTRLLTQDPQ